MVRSKRNKFIVALLLIWTNVTWTNVVWTNITVTLLISLRWFEEPTFKVWLESGQ